MVLMFFYIQFLVGVTYAVITGAPFIIGGVFVRKKTKYKKIGNALIIFGSIYIPFVITIVCIAILDICKKL